MDKCNTYNLFNIIDVTMTTPMFPLISRKTTALFKQQTANTIQQTQTGRVYRLCFNDICVWLETRCVRPANIRHCPSSPSNKYRVLLSKLNSVFGVCDTKTANNNLSERFSKHSSVLF